jgi:dolichol-phosphate mannosyltransferase
MVNGHRVAVVIPAFNEAARLDDLLPRLSRDVIDCIVVVSDASTDETAAIARRHGAATIEKTMRQGPGPAIRDALELLRREKAAELVAVMAANGKHDPLQVPDLVHPLCDGYDLVRGSRNLAGGYQVNMPRHRRLLIQVFTALLSIAVGQRVTDGTGGFQAYRLAILDDPRIELRQPWLDGRYELETYLFVKTLLLGYPWKEIPVRITYPERGQTYTRARPFVDWWRYFRPVILLRLGLKR